MADLKDAWKNTVRDLPSVYWVLWSGVFVNRVANFVGIFLAIYLKQRHHFDEAQAGWVVGIWGLGGTIAAPVGGVLTDRLGRRNTMLASLTMSAASVVALALVHQTLLLFLFAFIAGATQTVYFPASNAAITDIVPPSARPRAFGHVYWAMNLGLAIGFGIAGFVPSKYLVYLFLADAGTTLLCAGLTAWKIPETRPKDLKDDPVLEGMLRVLKDRVFIAFAGLHTVSLIIFTQFQLALPLDMTRHGVSSQGFSWLMAFNCLGVVLLQPWLTPLLQRICPSRLLALSTLLFGFGYALNAFVSTLPFYLLGAAFWTIGEVVGFPAASTLVSGMAPAELRGRYQGVFSMVWGISLGLSPIIGGQVMHRFGAPVLWWGCLIVSAGAAVGHLLTASSRRAKMSSASS